MEIVANRKTQFLVDVLEPSQVGQARRRILEYATSLGMNENDCGKIAIATTEMATNLIKHVGRGKLLCEELTRNGASGLRLLSLDDGLGIRDVGAALEDGYSTYGTGGNGLGAVRRLSTVFDLYSAPGRGTCILTEFWPQKPTNTPECFSFGAVSLAVRGEGLCGDGWGTRTLPDRSFFMVVDGLGHGTFAAEAARETERVLENSTLTSAASILRDCHDALKKTRGAVAAIAGISRETRTLTYAGIGNISATLIDPHGRRGIVSHNGTLGHQVYKLQEFNVPWNKDSILIMHSDGLGTKWDLNQYPGLTSKHPSIIAAILYRDFERQGDDVTVLVVKDDQ